MASIAARIDAAAGHEPAGAVRIVTGMIRAAKSMRAFQMIWAEIDARPALAAAMDPYRGKRCPVAR